MTSVIRELQKRGTENYPLEVLRFESGINILYHWHPEIEILYVRSGGFEVNVNMNTYKAKDGDIFFFSPSVCHSVTPIVKKAKYDAVIFYPSIVTFKEKNDINDKIIIPLTEGKIQFPERVENSKELKYIIEELIELNLSPADASFRMKSRLKLLQMLVFIYEKILFKMPESQSHDIKRIKDVTFYIEQNYSHKITLDTLSEISGISKGYFCSFFKHHTGKTPTEYINYVRINSAVDKIKNTDEKITAIALECGFENMGYFIRRFKSQAGITPSELRKKIFTKK